jgi:hypothetical protein
MDLMINNIYQEWSLVFMYSNVAPAAAVASNAAPTMYFRDAFVGRGNEKPPFVLMA